MHGITLNSIIRCIEIQLYYIIFNRLSFISYDFMIGKVDRYHWVDIGSSYVPSEVSCAILWAQLDACQQVTNMRRQFFEEYQLALSKGPATAVSGNYFYCSTLGILGFPYLF